MNFHIADTFTASFNRLSGQDQKAVKASVFDLHIDPTGNGLQLHRIDKCKDDHFWSARVNRDVRLIVHKTASSMLVAYVDHHDDAYAWAQRRRIEAHPTTGAIQIVEVRELVETVARPDAFDFITPTPVVPAKSLPFVGGSMMAGVRKAGGHPYRVDRAPGRLPLRCRCIPGPLQA